MGKYSWTNESDLRITFRKAWPWGFEATHRIEAARGGTMGFPDMLGGFPLAGGRHAFIAVEFKVAKESANGQIIELTPAQVSWWHRYAKNTLALLVVGVQERRISVVEFSPELLIPGTTKLTISDSLTEYGTQDIEKMLVENLHISQHIIQSQKFSK